MKNLENLARPGPDQSRWLTQAAKDLLARDLLDALTDAETLVRALRSDFDALVGSQVRPAPVERPEGYYHMPLDGDV